MLGERIYHVWFGTKRRIPLLEGNIEHDVRRLLRENSERAGVRLIEAETAVDHVHLIVAVPEDKPLASAMQQIKGGSSHALSLKYPELKMDTHETAVWQKGYSFRRLEPDNISAARDYVRSQQQRSFRHE
jgi:putative transposase